MPDNNKPQYISDLEQELLTLTPDEVKNVSAFVCQLRAKRAESKSWQSKSPLTSPSQEANIHE